MNVDCAINESQKQNDIDAHQPRFRDLHPSHRYNKPADESHRNQNKDDSLESDVFGQFFPKHSVPPGRDFLYTSFFRGPVLRLSEQCSKSETNRAMAPAAEFSSDAPRS